MARCNVFRIRLLGSFNLTIICILYCSYLVWQGTLANYDCVSMYSDFVWTLLLSLFRRIIIIMHCNCTLLLCQLNLFVPQFWLSHDRCILYLQLLVSYYSVELKLCGWVHRCTITFQHACFYRARSFRSCSSTENRYSLRVCHTSTRSTYSC